jgi:hypothetical protein
MLFEEDYLRCNVSQEKHSETCAGKMMLLNNTNLTMVIFARTRVFHCISFIKNRMEAV